MISSSAPPRSPKIAQDGPKMPQGGPKMAQRWRQDGAKMAPRGPQQGPKTSPRRLQVASHRDLMLHYLRLASVSSPETSQDRPRHPPGPPGTSRDPPGKAQDGSEKAPKWPQHCDNKRRVDHILPSEWGWPVMRRRRSQSAAPFAKGAGRAGLPTDSVRFRRPRLDVV